MTSCEAMMNNAVLLALVLVIAGCTTAAAPDVGQADHARPEVSHTNPKMDGPPSY
jgi:hypothetical protein